MSATNRLRIALGFRDDLKAAVMAEMEEHSKRGELRMYSQMPSWGAYMDQCRRVEKIQDEITSPGNPNRSTE